MADPGQVTELLRAWGGGERAAMDRLIPLVYTELRRLARLAMRREASSHTLEPTALVHEAWFRLAGQRATWQGRQHFFRIAATVMRRVLLQHARAKHAAKRGGLALTLPLDEGLPVPGLPLAEVVSLDLALCGLESLDRRQAEILDLRVFAGLTVEEVADVMGLSTATVKRDYRMATAFLRRRLQGEPRAAVA